MPQVERTQQEGYEDMDKDNQMKPNTSEKKPKLTKRMKLFIPIWLLARNVQEACKLASIAPVTFYDWKKNNETFREALLKAENEVLADAMSDLRLCVTEAVRVMKETLSHRDAALALRAANIIAEHARLSDIPEIKELQRQMALIESGQDKQ